MKRPWIVIASLIVGACGGSTGAAIGKPSGADPDKFEVVRTATTDVSSTAQSIDAVSEVDTIETLRAAFDILMQRRIECGRKPFACNVSLVAQAGSPLFAELNALIEARRAANITATGGGAIRYRIEKVEIESRSSALVFTCVTDDAVLVDGDIIFDDSMLSSLTTWTMSKVDGTWLWADATSIRWTKEEDLCGFDD